MWISMQALLGAGVLFMAFTTSRVRMVRWSGYVLGLWCIAGAVGDAARL